MRTEVSRLQNRLGTTMVYVTHDQTEAMTLGDRVAVMRAGRIQQVGSPTELYEKPANVFVAGFIGSPAMNFVPVGVSDGLLHTPLGDVAADARTRNALAGVDAGRTLLLGVRPEHFEDAALVGADRAREGLRFSATVDVLESLGSDKFAYFSFEGEKAATAELDELARDSGAADVPGGGAQLVARLDAASRVREGDKADLWVDTAKAHLFDPETGAGLTV
jgi:multiple sugar transport system ATP-binding protein